MKFQVGDEVVVCSFIGLLTRVKVGYNGKVVEVDRTGIYPIIVSFGNFTELFYEEELRLLTKLEKALK